MDPPARLLAVAVAALPEHRREWGTAIAAELTYIHGRSARWRFAFSAVRATLSLPPAGGWRMLALVGGMAVAAVAAVGPAVGTVVPGLTVFATTFTGLIGAMAMWTVARSLPLRIPVPVPTVLVAAAVAAAITATVVLLRREPAAAQYLPAPAAVYLAVVLAGCLRIAAMPPRSLGTDRLAPHLGVASGFLIAGWFLLLTRLDGYEPPAVVVTVLGLVLVSVPIAASLGPAFALVRGNRSVRAGLSAVIWAVTAMMPLTYAVWLPEALRRHAIDGRTLDGEVVAPVGANLIAALTFCLGIFPLLGLTIGAVGTALGAQRRR
jgi:hypothetical protein